MRKFHTHCFACGEGFENGLKLQFKLLEDGSIRGAFQIANKYQGYDDVSHGGIVATILVSSMVNLFYLRDGKKLTTARLNIRYVKPVPVEEVITIRAVSHENIRKFYRAKSQISLGSTVLAEAEGFFTNSVA